MLVLSPQPVPAFDMSPRTPDFGFFFDHKMSERHLPVSTPDSYSSSLTSMEGGVDPKMLSYPGQSQGESRPPQKTLKRKASSDVDNESVERPSKRPSYSGYTAPDYRNAPVMPGPVHAGPKSSAPSLPQTNYNYRTENTGYANDRSVYSSTPYSDGGEFLTASHTSPLPINADRAWTLSPSMIASAAPYNSTPLTGGYTTPGSASFVTPPQRPTETTGGYTFPPIFSTANSSSNLPSLSSAAGGDKPVPVNPPSAKPRCWDHGCNGRTFSTFSNLLRHQRERSGVAQKTFCPRCGAEFTRSTARNMHLQNAKCKARRHSSYQ